MVLTRAAAATNADEGRSLLAAVCSSRRELEHLLAASAQKAGAAAWRGPLRINVLRVAALADRADAVAPLVGARMDLAAEMENSGTITDLEVFLIEHHVYAQGKYPRLQLGPPLFLAALQGHTAMLKAMLAAGAPLQRRSNGMSVYDSLLNTGWGCRKDSVCVLEALIAVSDEALADAAIRQGDNVFHHYTVSTSGSPFCCEACSRQLSPYGFHPTQLVNLLCLAAYSLSAVVFQDLLTAVLANLPNFDVHQASLIVDAIVEKGSVSMLQQFISSPLVVAHGGGHPWVALAKGLDMYRFPPGHGSSNASARPGRSPRGGRCSCDLERPRQDRGGQ